MRRCVIVGGAGIGDYSPVRQALRDGDYLVYCDSGLQHRDGLGAGPDLIVGDFDSHEDPHLPVETIVLPREKDDTDTVYAVKEAIRRGYTEFLLVGAAGGRLDHTLGNVSILLYLDSLGLKGRLMDDYGEMEIVSREPVHISREWSYFSLLNISGCARDVTVTGARYPLRGAEITCDYAYGVSNEVLPGQEAVVTVGEGRLLLIRIR